MISTDTKKSIMNKSTQKESPQPTCIQEEDVKVSTCHNCLLTIEDKSEDGKKSNPPTNQQTSADQRKASQQPLDPAYQYSNDSGPPVNQTQNQSYPREPVKMYYQDQQRVHFVSDRASSENKTPQLPRFAADTNPQTVYDYQLQYPYHQRCVFRDNKHVYNDSMRQPQSYYADNQQLVNGNQQCKYPNPTSNNYNRNFNETTQLNTRPASTSRRKNAPLIIDDVMLNQYASPPTLDGRPLYNDTPPAWQIPTQNSHDNNDYAKFSRKQASILTNREHLNHVREMAPLSRETNALNARGTNEHNSNREFSPTSRETQYICQETPHHSRDTPLLQRDECQHYRETKYQDGPSYNNHVYQESSSAAPDERDTTLTFRETTLPPHTNSLEHVTEATALDPNWIAYKLVCQPNTDPVVCKNGIYI